MTGRTSGMNNGREATAPGLTALLQAWSLGDASALERLTPIVYSELHRLAHLQMAGERLGHVLQPSALVNEAFVRLMGTGGGEWENRRQFFAAAARLMRQVLVDFARAEEARKRGGRDAQVKVFDMDELSKPQPSVSLEYMIAIDEALTRLEALDQTQAQVVELRFFGGLENAEIARMLAISERTRASRVAARPCVPLSFVELEAVTPEKHRRAGELFDKLVGLSVDRQQDYLDVACGSDHELRQYVAGLLDAERQAPGSFLDRPAVQEAVNRIAELAASSSPVSGTQLGVYSIGGQIGLGGMGTVYEALDTRLGRKVAIKFLPPAFFSDSDRIGRFRQEARVISLLNHPNIVSIYDAELEQGRCYIATEFVEGKTLRQLD